MADELKNFTKNMADSLTKSLNGLEGTAKSKEKNKVKEEEMSNDENKNEEVKEEPVDTIINKTSETTTINLPLYQCEIIKNKINGNVTGLKEEVESIVIKNKKTSKQVMKLKTVDEVNGFFELFSILSSQLSSGQNYQQTQQHSLPDGYTYMHNPHNVQPDHPYQDYINTNTSPVKPPLSGTGDQYTDGITLLDKIIARQGGGKASKTQQNPYRDAMDGGEAISQQLNIGGITEDQLTPEQKEVVAKYKGLMGENYGDDTGTNEQKGSVSKLKKEREQKRLKFIKNK